jgi:hypothetical protein
LKSLSRKSGTERKWWREKGDEDSLETESKDSG